MSEYLADLNFFNFEHTIIQSMAVKSNLLLAVLTQWISGSLKFVLFWVHLMHLCYFEQAVMCLLHFEHKVMLKESVKGKTIRGGK